MHEIDASVVDLSFLLSEVNTHHTHTHTRARARARMSFFFLSLFTYVCEKVIEKQALYSVSEWCIYMSGLVCILSVPNQLSTNLCVLCWYSKNVCMYSEAFVSVPTLLPCFFHSLLLSCYFGCLCIYLPLSPSCPARLYRGRPSECMNMGVRISVYFCLSPLYIHTCICMYPFCR